MNNSQTAADARDRGWLFGLLAGKLGAIEPAALTKALLSENAGNNKPLDVRLCETEAITGANAAAVGNLVDFLSEKYKGDLAAALAALEGGDESLADPKCQTLVATVSPVSITLAAPGADAPTRSIGGGGDVGFQLPQEREESLIGGRYRKLRYLAQGNLGVLDVARDLELDREVALKQIQERHVRKPLMRSLFEVEALVTGGLDHPGIVPVYSLGRDDAGRPFYTMRLIRGQSLRDAIVRFHQKGHLGVDSRDYNLQLRGLLQRFVAACYVVAYAHSRGVVHRDLKPANIMLGDYGETIVVDWGLAKPLGQVPESDESTETPLMPAGSSSEHTAPYVKGTPAFMSPEQARKELVTPASDIYCLGATLYAILTGKAPFPRGTTDEVLRAVRAGDFPPPRQVMPRVPVALQAICLKAMATEPARRFATVRELAAEIEAWLAGEPVKCHVEPWYDQALRWGRRHRVVVSTAGAAIGVMALAFIPLAILFKQKNEAVEQLQTAVVQAKRAEATALQKDAQSHIASRLAQANWAQSRRIVVEHIVPFAETLAYLPQGEPLRRRLMNTAVDQYRGFLQQAASTPELRREAVRVFRTAANVERLLGADESAGGLYDEAIKVGEVLASNSPDRADQRLMARVLNDRGNWHLEHGDLAQAENALNAALDYLHPNGPRTGQALDDRNDRQVEGMIWTGMAHLRGIQGRDDAIDAAREAVRLFASLKRDPAVWRIDHLLHARSLIELAELEASSGARDQAETSLERADELVQELLADNEANLDALETHVMIRLARETDSPELDETITGLRKMQSDHDSIPRYRRLLAQALVAKGRSRLAAGAGSDAAALADEAAGLVPVDLTAGNLHAADVEIAATTAALRARAARRQSDPRAKELFDKALAHYGRMRELCPTNAAIHKEIEALEREKLADAAG